MRASRCSEAVDNQVNLTQISPDDIDRPLLNLIRKAVAIDTRRVQALSDGGLVESRRVVPAGRAGLALAAGTLEEDTERIGTACECRSDPGCKSVSSRCPYH